MDREPQNDTRRPYSAARNWKISAALFLFCCYVCFLYWRELGRPAPVHEASVVVPLINAWVAILLIWLVRHPMVLRERLVALVGIGNFLYRSILGIAPGGLAPLVRPMRIAFFVAWAAAAVLSLSLMKSAMINISRRGDTAP